MKKFIAIMFALSLSLAGASAAEQNQNLNTNNNKPPFCQKFDGERAKRSAEFDQKLGLTEEQKVQARELRKQGFDKMRPVMEQIKVKRQQAEALQKTGNRTKAQEQELNKLNEEIRALNKDAHKIRQANMKEFEEILTKDQQTTLKEMKKEGRENFKKNFKNGRPPMPPCRFEK